MITHGGKEYYGPYLTEANCPKCGVTLHQASSKDEKDTMTICLNCGYEEHDTIDDDGILRCSRCGAMIVQSETMNICVFCGNTEVR